jgi:RNA polymerase sigma factor (sigma-70 family)
MDRVQNLIRDFLKGRSSVYDTIEGRIRRYVHSMRLSEGEDRNDIIAEVIASLYANLEQGKFHGDSLKALEVYIYSIAKNITVKYHRRQRRIQYWGEIPDSMHMPSLAYDSGITKKDLSQKILQAMDERCRHLLDLKFKQFWSDQELADHYKMTKNAMSTAISRCVKKARGLEFVKKEL